MRLGPPVSQKRALLALEVARDLTAETFAQAFRGRRRFRGTTEAEAPAWLYTIGRGGSQREFRDP